MIPHDLDPTFWCFLYAPFQELMHSISSSVNSWERQSYGSRSYFHDKLPGRHRRSRQSHCKWLYTNPLVFWTPYMWRNKSKDYLWWIQNASTSILAFFPFLMDKRKNSTQWDKKKKSREEYKYIICALDSTVRWESEQEKLAQCLEWFVLLINFGNYDISTLPAPPPPTESILGRELSELSLMRRFQLISAIKTFNWF